MSKWFQLIQGDHADVIYRTELLKREMAMTVQRATDGEKEMSGES